MLSLVSGCGAKTGLLVPDAGLDLDARVIGPDGGLPCVEVPVDGGPVELPLETETELSEADVVFLIDVTASMQDEINGISATLSSRIAPAVDEAIPDAQLAVATFADFPVEPFGDRIDRPFTLLLPMTDDVRLVQSVVSGIELGNGRDEPESHVEALYQLVTGEGIGDFVAPSFGCPSGGTGFPCFRSGALPVILLFTDAPMHNGPGGTEPYGGSVRPAPHRYTDAVSALTELGARVIGFDSGEGRDGEENLRRLARDTNTLDESGAPMVFDIGRSGERLSTNVVSAIQTFADVVVFDVDAVLVDVDPSDGVDATQFVEALVPLRAEPAEGVASIDTAAGVFRGVQSGTRVVFQLRVRNDAVIPGATPQRFVVNVVFRGDGRARLGQRSVELVIPALDGAGCEPG